MTGLKCVGLTNVLVFSLSILHFTSSFFLAAAAAVFPRFRRAPAAAARSGSGSEGRGLSGGTTGTPSARRTGTDNSSESGKRRGPFFGGGRKRRVSDTPIEPDCSCDRATDHDRDRERCRNLFGKPRPFPPRPGSGGRAALARRSPNS